MKTVPERDVFHPLVAEWLEANGYTYEHEFALPDFGRVDFKATHKQDGHVLLVECKPNDYAIRAIMQVKTYAAQIPGAKAAIAVVAGRAAEEERRVASKHNVQIIELEAEGIDPQGKYMHPVAVLDAFKRVGFIYEEVPEWTPRVISEIITKSPDVISALLNLLILDRLILSVPLQNEKLIKATDEIFQACLMLLKDNSEYHPFVRDALLHGDPRLIFEKLELGLCIYASLKNPHFSAEPEEKNS